MPCRSKLLKFDEAPASEPNLGSKEGFLLETENISSTLENTYSIFSTERYDEFHRLILMQI